MIEEEPVWSYTTPSSLWRWYGHVHLTDRHAVGEWLVVELETGKVLWDRDFEPPNTISGITGEVIIGTEWIVSGPTQYSAGVWGISLTSGEILWRAEGSRSGFWGRLLDRFVGVSEKPLHVLPDGKCITSSGRVLDAKSGEEIETVEVKDPNPKKRLTPAERLYREGHITLKNGRVVRQKKPGFMLELVENDKCLWTFSLAEHHRFMDGNYFSHRLHDRECYLIVSDDEQLKPKNPEDPRSVYVRNPCRFEIWVLSFKKGGEVVQKVPIGDKLSECRIEAIDNRFLLVSEASKTLRAYRLRSH